MGSKLRIVIVAQCALFFFSASPGAARGQTDGAGAFQVEGALRSRVEAWDWFGPEPEGEYAYVGSLARLGIGQQWKGIGWSFEVAAPLLFGLPDDAAIPAPGGQLGLGASYYAANDQEVNVAGIFPKQANLRIGAVPGLRSHGARVGRFEFVDGAEVAPTSPTLAALKRDRIAHRLLGNFGWSHVGRSFDGIHYAYSAPRWNVAALAARPTQGVFDADGWGGLEDVAVGYGSVTLREQPSAAGEARVFLLHYRDARNLLKTDNRPIPVRQSDLAKIDVATLGAHYLGLVETEAGTVDALLWGALQGGEWGALGHRAWAGAAELGIQPTFLPQLQPWLRVGHFRSSGDADRADSRHGTFFQILPTPRIYSRLPFYNLMNLQEWFVSLAVRPSSDLSLRSDLRRIGLESSSDLWYAGGGAFEDTSFGFAGRPSGGADDLATLFDLSADYRVTQRISTGLYFGYAAGGEVVERTYGSADSGLFSFIEIQYRF